MSNSTHTARKDRREEQLIRDVSHRRPLFSALSVLVGSGAVALSALPSQAQARSALDDMAWAPQQHTRVTQGPAVASGAGPAQTEAVSILNVPADGTLQPSVVNHSVSSTASAVPQEADAAITRTSGATARALAQEPAATISAAPQRRAELAPMPRSRGFADAGLIPVDTQASHSVEADVARANESREPQAATQRMASAAREAAMVASPVSVVPARDVRTPVAVQSAAPSLLGLAASPMRSTTSTRRAPDMQVLQRRTQWRTTRTRMTR